MPMAGIPTETVTVISRKTVYDDLHEPVSEAVAERDVDAVVAPGATADLDACLLYTSPSPRDISGSRMPSSA